MKEKSYPTCISCEHYQPELALGCEINHSVWSRSGLEYKCINYKTKYIEWEEDFENSWLRPLGDDGEEEFCYWWEDMRPREVSKSIKEAYECGYRRGKKER